MKLELDKQADAAYIHLSPGTYAFGKDLDDVRRVDYAEDETPIGVELLYVSEGVDVEGLPRQHEIARLLEDHDIQTYTLRREQGSKNDPSSVFFVVDFGYPGSSRSEGVVVDERDRVTA